MRLGSMVTGGGGHDVYPGSGPLDGGGGHDVYPGSDPTSCLIDIDDMSITRVDLPRDRRD